MEIEFRGKRLDNNEWVYGYYVKNEHMGVEKHIIVTNWAQVYVNSHYIIPNTLGQYINRLDKNKQKLFVGDILTRDSYWSIQIEQENGSFIVRDTDKVRRNNLCINEPIYNWNFSEWTKVGNIYENPELLEEQ